MNYGVQRPDCRGAKAISEGRLQNFEDFVARLLVPRARVGDDESARAKDVPEQNLERVSTQISCI